MSTHFIALRKLQIKEIRISRVSIIVIFLAMIRCISEVLRLNYYSSISLTYENIKPFLVGALVTSIASLIMVILSFYSKHRVIIAIAILTIIVLFILKYSSLP